MYLSSIAPVAYADPWAVPFDQRLKRLALGSPRIAYFYSWPDNSTFRYRVYNVCQSLKAVRGRNAPSASWFTAADFEWMPRVMDCCDVLVLGRNSLYTDRIARLVALARARGRRVLFDCDDLVFDQAYTHLIMDTLKVDVTSEESWNQWFAYTGRVAATFALADAAIVTNAYLAARAGAWSGKPIAIIPNYLNRQQQQVSDAVWRAKDAGQWASDGRTHLGYFSGSPSHDRDFALIAPALARILDDDPSLHLRVAGYLNVAPELDRHRDRIEVVPFQDFVNLQREIGITEINLVPLQNNTFTNCKSELKWFEAAAVGALTIATPTFTFARAIQHGENGWLAAAHEWEAVLRAVLQDLDEHRRQVAPAARADALQRYGWDKQVATITTAFLGVA